MTQSQAPAAPDVPAELQQILVGCIFEEAVIELGMLMKNGAPLPRR